MNIGIMEMSAIEDFSEQHVPPLDITSEDCFRVYFRQEVFGTVPLALLDDVRGHMAAAGGYEWDPHGRVLRSMHGDDHYAGMVRSIVQSVADLLKSDAGQNRLIK